MNEATQTRGERNNNPGNIERDATRWQGMSRDQSGDARFVVFKTPEDGIRALAKVILSYCNQHGLNTVRGIINRWAPPVENDTGAYVKHVAERLSVGPDAMIDPTKPEVMEMLVSAIISHENGRVAYSDDVLVRGVDRAIA